MADSTTSLPVKTSTDGDVVVGVEAGAVIGLDTAANTIKIDPANNDIAISQTGTDNKIQISSAAGENTIDVTKINGNAITGANLPINIAAIAGTAPPVPGKLAIDGANSTALPVTISGTSGTEKFDLQGPTSVAQNLGTATVNFDDITVSTTGHLLSIEFSSQVQMRFAIQTFDGTTAVTVSNAMTPAGGGSYHWQTPGDNYITLAGGTNKHWRVVATNLDKNTTADVYMTAFWSEV